MAVGAKADWTPWLSSGCPRPWRRRERSNSSVDDPANVDVAKGWCRIMGLVPIALFLTCALVVRNLAVSDAFIERGRTNVQIRRSRTEKKGGGAGGASSISRG